MDGKGDLGGSRQLNTQVLVGLCGIIVSHSLSQMSLFEHLEQHWKCEFMATVLEKIMTW